MSTPTPWRWTHQRQRAATLLAEGVAGATICRDLGINPVTLYRWRQQPEFHARFSHLLAAHQQLILDTGLAQRQARIQAIQNIVTALDRLIAERADHPDYQDVPGGKTGLLVRKKSLAGRHVVYNFTIDSDLIRLYLRCLRQIAEELGEWCPSPRPIDPDVQHLLDSIKAMEDAPLDDSSDDLPLLPPPDPDALASPQPSRC